MWGDLLLATHALGEAEKRIAAVRELIAPFLAMDGNPLIEVRLVDEALRTGRVPGLGAKKVGQAEKTP